MPFNSFPYLAFLAAVVAVYWLLSPNLRRYLVFTASVAFYASWSLLFLWLPLVVAALVYVLAKLILGDPAKARKWMWTGICCALALLIFFKYRVFLGANVGFLSPYFRAQPSSLETSVAFPMGISFYTFEAIAYLIDVRQGRVRLPTFLDLCLFFFFWPNILSGPIVRARELMPQLHFSKAFEPCFFFEGFDRIIWGLVQKNVIANVLGNWVDRGFSAQSSSIPSTLDGWFLAVAFGLQVYFDFAGYTNLAIGAARLLGITFPENFRQPYLATTPPDFWNRWHMSLSRWIRDYLFFPINAKWMAAPLPLYLSLVGVMALVGLWHGAGWTFVLWGMLHGTYLVAYRIYESWKSGRPALGVSRWTNRIWRALTLVGITVAWVLFRADSLGKAGVILSSMFYRIAAGRAFSPLFYLFTVAVALFCVIEPALMRSLTEIEEQAGTTGPSLFRVLVRPIVYLAGIMLFTLFDQNNAQFIYSQF